MIRLQMASLLETMESYSKYVLPNGNLFRQMIEIWYMDDNYFQQCNRVPLELFL